MKKNSIFIVIFIISILSKQINAQIIFPRAFAFAIDDLGWNIGNDDGDVDGVGPYRIGIDRKMDLKDYKPIVEVGKKVGVRIQSLFVLAEMDRLNILAKHPSTTWMGEKWDNTKNVCNEQINIMNYVKNNAAYLEFGLHGVGHEYWDAKGRKNRAEWYSTDDNKPRETDTIIAHIQCFKDIMAQYGLDEKHGHSFPESFVPCAYGYYWNPGNKNSTGKLLSDNGVKYVNTLFDYIRELNPPEGENGGGFDNGVIVVNRINYGNNWYSLSSLPTVPLSEQKSDIIETHWSNWLAQDNFLQKQTINKFIQYYKMVQQQKDRYVAKNTEQFHSQWLYKKYTKISENKNGFVTIDNTNMPNEAYQNNILGVIVLKVELKKGEHISEAFLNGKQIPAYFEEEGYGFMYLPILKQQKYTLEYKIGKKLMSPCVYNNGTYNIYSLTTNKTKTELKIKLYGTQNLIISTKKVKKIESENKNIKILSKNYDEQKQLLTLKVSALDIQGEKGVIKLLY